MHPEADETLCLLEGRIRLHLEGTDDQLVSAGAVSVVPRGTAHAFGVESDGARILVLFTPASAISEEFFRLAGEPASDPSLPPPPPDPERFAAAAKRAGLRLLGPPPFRLAADPPMAAGANALP